MSVLAGSPALSFVRDDALFSWMTFHAKFFKVALQKDAPASIQEGALTKPIWHTP